MRVAGKAAVGVAVVRFCGETQFAPGTWVGLELSAAAAEAGHGKNDGSVRDVKYFEVRSGVEGMVLVVVVVGRGCGCRC